MTLKSKINSYINHDKSADQNSPWRISCFNVYLQRTYCNCVSYVSFVTSYDHCYHYVFAVIVFWMIVRLLFAFCSIKISSEGRKKSIWNQQKVYDRSDHLWRYRIIVSISYLNPVPNALKIGWLMECVISDLITTRGFSLKWTVLGQIGRPKRAYIGRSAKVDGP